MERGIKRVPRKIFDFSGCLKGVRLIKSYSKIREFEKIYQKDLTKRDKYVLQW